MSGYAASKGSDQTARMPHCWKSRVVAQIFIYRISKAVILLWIFFVIYIHVCLCYAVLCVPYSLVVTCWERADLLVLVCVFLCFVTFQYADPGQVWYLIVSIPDLCLPFLLHVSTCVLAELHPETILADEQCPSFDSYRIVCGLSIEEDKYRQAPVQSKN